MTIDEIIHSIKRARTGTSDEVGRLTRAINAVQDYRDKELKRRAEILTAAPCSLNRFHARNALHNMTETYRHVELLERKMRDSERSVLQISGKKQIENIRRNVHVRNVETDAESIMVYTKEIVGDYEDSIGERATAHLGTFCLTWTKGRRAPHVVSETYPNRPYPHPCIGRREDMCLGEFDDVLTHNARAGRLDMCIDVLMHFLNTFDAERPFRQMSEILENEE